MRFLVLLTDADPGAWERATEAERAAVFAMHDAFDRAVSERGSVLGGAALAGDADAVTVRTVDGAQVVTDGPYAETVEQLGGYYEIDVPDRATAVELCALLPDSYVIEVRPVVEMGEAVQEASA